MSRHAPTYEELLDRIAILESQVARLSTNQLGCLTRPALELFLESINDRLFDPSSELVFVGWDIDSMKAANTTYGEPGTNARLYRSYDPILQHDAIGTVWSGDEYIAVVSSSDAIGFASRMQDNLRTNDLSATFVIVNPRDYADWNEAIDEQRVLCGQHKAAGERNSIHDHR